MALYTGKIFAGLNPYEIVYLMVNASLLNIVHPVGFGETGKKDPTNLVSPKDIELMDAWASKFNSIKAALRMFGTNEDSFLVAQPEGDVDLKKHSQLQNYLGNVAFACSHMLDTPLKIRYDSKGMKDFRPFFKPDDAKNELSLIQSSYKKNLEIIEEVKLYTGFEFYLDTTGDVVFKPPFWNVDVRDNPIYVLDDDELLSLDIEESESELVTRVEVVGSLHQLANTTSDLATPRGVFTDYNLARRFGMRTQQIPGRTLTSANMCYYHAISEIDRVNSSRIRGNLTIIGRPELRLGFPIYIKSKDMFVYIDNISHNFGFGSGFTTQIAFSAVRKKYVGANFSGVTSSKNSETTALFSIRGASSMLVNEIDPAVSEDYVKQTEDLNKNLSLKQKAVKEAQKKNEKEVPRKDVTDKTQTGGKKSDKAQARAKNLFKTNREGVWVERPFTDPKVQAILKKLDNAKDKDDSGAYLSLLEEAIPVSDENGYDLIGAYENGRTLKLTAEGKLVKKGSLTSLAKLASLDTKDNKLVSNTTKKPNKNLKNKENTTETLTPVEGGFQYLQNTSRFLASLAPELSKTKEDCPCQKLIKQGKILDPTDPRFRTINEADTKQARLKGDR